MRAPKTKSCFSTTFSCFATRYRNLLFLKEDLLDFNVAALNELRTPILNQLVDLHCSSIPKSRFSYLPISVRRQIYSKFASSEFSRIYIAMEKDKDNLIGGVLVQNFQSSKQLSDFMSYLRYMPAILASAIRHPITWLSQTFAEIRLNPRRFEGVYISAIYVTNSHQGKGVGRALIQKVKLDFPLTRLTVMTESHNNTGLNFYLSTNWKVKAQCINTILLTLDS